MLRLFKYGIPAMLIAGIFLFLFRTSILIGIGNYLIDENELEKVKVAFVLGGNSYDRGTKAFQLYQEEICEKIVCLGGNVPSIFVTIGINKTEAETSREHIIKNFGAPEENVIALMQGTSTMEESEIILNYCVKNNLNKIIVVSDKFHTHRIRGVFNDKFEKNKIEVLLVGTPSSLYDEETWWKSEAGLIMVNNEYVKTFYYWLKY